MADDESSTLTRVLDQRRVFIEPLIREHEGRVVKLMGDGVLAEFPSVTAAVNSAVAIQHQARIHFEGSGASEPILLRIGINLGEVIVEGDDIYGDGVNVAARIEALAQPGGIAVSGAAHEQIRTKLPYEFKALGSQQVKNIPDPIEVFHLDADEQLVSKSTANLPHPRSKRRKPRVLVAAALVLATAAVLLLNGQLPLPAMLQAESVVPERRKDLPSLVVLPFDDLSVRSDQAYFSDGITDSLITDLSRVSGVLIIAPNTSFAYRDKQADITNVAETLGVSYVVTGSVQKADTRIRVNARLTDAGSGLQLWADRFDRDLADIFALQDEVTGMVIAALQVELSDKEQQMLAMRDTSDLEAYDLFLQAREMALTVTGRNGGARSRAITNPGSGAAVVNHTADAAEAIDAALVIDPDFSRARSLQVVQNLDLTGAALLSSVAMIEQADQLAREALDAGDDLPRLHSVIALGHLFRSEYEMAVKSARQAVLLGPSYADGYAILAWVLHFADQTQDAMRAMEIALRLNPVSPVIYLQFLSEAEFAAGNAEAALAHANAVLASQGQGQRAWLFRAASRAQLGQFEGAAQDIREILREEPKFNIRSLPAIVPYKNVADQDRLVTALRLAGLPE